MIWIQLLKLEEEIEVEVPAVDLVVVSKISLINTESHSLEFKTKELLEELPKLVQVVKSVL